jgi:hypothetical protein
MSSPDIFAQMAEPLSDGTWVNSRIARIIEIIRDYDPMLEVRWLPRADRIAGADVFQIVDKRIDRVAFSVKDEASFDESVLDRIFEADLARVQGSPATHLQKIDIHNANIKLLKAKEKMEEEEDRNDKVAAILKSPLNAYKHDGYRYDKHPTDQPKKVIIDATPRYKKKS